MYVRLQLFLPYKIFSLRNVDQTTKYISCHAWKAKPKNQPDGSANDGSKKDAVKAHPNWYELHARGLPKKSWVKISQIRTLAVERIGKMIARASPEELAQVVEGLNEIIGT